MTPDKQRYEVWRKGLDGSWSIASDEAGATHFEELKRAERLLDAQFNQGTVMEAALVHVRPVKIMNCSGAAAAGRMGLRNVKMSGDSKIIVGPPLRRFGK